MVDVGNGVLVVVDLDMLLELPVLVPILNLDNVLRSDGTPSQSVSLPPRRWGRLPQGGQSTYPQHLAVLDQARKLSHAAALILASATTPEHAGFGVGGEVDGLERHAVGAQDGLEARGCRDDVRGAGGQGGEDPEGGVGRVGCHGGLFVWRGQKLG